MRRLGFLTVMWVVVSMAPLLLDGCAAPPKRPPPIAAAPQGPETLKPGTVVKAAQLEPFSSQTRVYEVALGDRAGKNLAAKLEPIGPHLWRYSLQETRVVFLEVAPDGAIGIQREQELGDQVEIVYEPALTMIPASLTFGEAFEGQSRMTVKDLKTAAVRDKGTCSHRVELTGRRNVQTPAGAFDAYILESTRHIHLGMAQVEVAILTAYAQDGGVVAESITHTTKALGIFGGTEQEVLKLSR